MITGPVSYRVFRETGGWCVRDFFFYFRFFNVVFIQGNDPRHSVIEANVWKNPIKPSNLLLCHHSARVLWILNSFLSHLLFCCCSVMKARLYWDSNTSSLAFDMFILQLYPFLRKLIDWLEIYLRSFGEGRGGGAGGERNTRGPWRVVWTVLPCIGQEGP